MADPSGVDLDKMLTSDGSASQTCLTLLGDGLGDCLGDWLGIPDTALAFVVHDRGILAAGGVWREEDWARLCNGSVGAAYADFFFSALAGRGPCDLKQQLGRVSRATALCFLAKMIAELTHAALVQ